MRSVYKKRAVNIRKELRKADYVNNNIEMESL